jgi:hypothetical protein
MVLWRMAFMQSVKAKGKGHSKRTHVLQPIAGVLRHSGSLDFLHDLGDDDIPKDGLKGLTGVLGSHVYLSGWGLGGSEREVVELGLFDDGEMQNSRWRRGNGRLEVLSGIVGRRRGGEELS